MYPRGRLVEAHRIDPDRLFAHLAALLGQAATELGPADPSRLFRRFIGWAVPDGQACRACGKAGHDAIPGVPPRLLPCEIAERLRDHGAEYTFERAVGAMI